MEHKYGTFTPEQLSWQKKSLHRAIFWLLLYKDPQISFRYRHVDFNKYFTNLMLRINGLSQLLFNPPQVVTLLSVLEAAFVESQKENFNFQQYRKLILDAQSLVDKIEEVD